MTHKNTNIIFVIGLACTKRTHLRQNLAFVTPRAPAVRNLGACAPASSMALAPMNATAEKIKVLQYAELETMNQIACFSLKMK